MSNLANCCKHKSMNGICRANRSIEKCPYELEDRRECEDFTPLFSAEKIKELKNNE